VRNDGETYFPIYSKEEDRNNRETKFWRRGLGHSVQKLELGGQYDTRTKSHGRDNAYA
jgi:hypothetical protein